MWPHYQSLQSVRHCNAEYPQRPKRNMWVKASSGSLLSSELFLLFSFLRCFGLKPYIPSSHASLANLGDYCHRFDLLRDVQLHSWSIHSADITGWFTQLTRAKPTLWSHLCWDKVPFHCNSCGQSLHTFFPELCNCPCPALLSLRPL